MTALAAPRPGAQWNWPRVGALSGTVSLHVAAIVLLLVPPVAMQVMRPLEDIVTVVDLIEEKPAPTYEEPPLPTPKPIVHEVRQQPRPHPVETPAPVPVIPSEAPGPTVAPTPPATDGAPAATPNEVGPVALAYDRRTKIPYPRDALQRREQGTVVLRVLVGIDGTATAVEIEKSSGSRSLDNAAREAVRRWTFQAGTRNGIAEPLWARVPIVFDLRML